MKLYTHRERKRRRAVAAIIASVIMFAMLFTTGTAYFLFVNNQNQAYSQSLVSRGNALQDRLNELFTVNTKLSGTNTLGFTLMNTGNVPISVASVLLMSSSGNVLCLYKNPSAQSPCATNTTPALGGAVNPGVTSGLFDTGYAYVSPNTYSLRVVTSRGNGQTQSYPPVVPDYVLQAQSSGSVTVDMSTFKYIKIFTSGPSNQEFINCSGSNTCGDDFDHTVNSGHVLVFGLGWYQQPAPTISDTFGDTYTLGVSASVAQGVSPSLVQKARAQASGCSTCNLAYPTNVGYGNVLALGLGWYNQNPPTISDSRGDSFSLGVANSIASTSAPTLVQKAFQQVSSTCTTTCTVAFVSNVGAGNLLVLAVGWNSAAVAPTISDTLGDSYTLGVSRSWNSQKSYIWYSTALSSGANTIKATFASSTTPSMSAYEISGATAAGLTTSTGGDNSGSASVSSFTPVANSFVIGNVETSSASTFTAGTGYTLVLTSGSAACNAATPQDFGCSEYRTLASGSTSASFSFGGSPDWADSAIAFPPATYFSNIWYATVVSSGANTVTASFSSATTASMAIYEINGAGTTVSTSTGSSTGSTSLSVTSFTPSANSFVIGNAETASSTSAFTAGSGLTLTGTCSSVYGCAEHQAVVSSATTVPMTIASSALWVESAIAFPPGSNTFYSYIWYSTASTTGNPFITATFSASAAVTASASLYDLSNTVTTGITTSTGSSSTGSTSASVTSFTPNVGSFVIANVETSSAASKFTPGLRYNMVEDDECRDAPGNGCSEYQQGVSSANTAPLTINTAATWVESAIAFSPGAANTQTGALVNGYPAVAIPACFDDEDHNTCGTGQPIAFRIAFTNRDPQGRTVTLWPGSAMSVGTVTSAGDDAAHTSPFYIVDGLNSATYPSGVVAYNSTQNFVQLPPDVPTTLYFASTLQLGTTVNVVNSQSGVPYAALFTLTGQFSDNTLYGQTIPFPAGIVTASTATFSATSGGNGATITITTPLCATKSINCFLPSRMAMVGWIDSTNKIVVLKTFTTDAIGNIASVTFNIPTASAGWYTVALTDYVNTYFITFNHT